jgi:hypothetical protein
MNSEADSVASGAVLRTVSQTLGMHLEVGTSAISARVIPNSRDLVISFTAATPELARRGAQVTAQTFLERRSQTARDALLTQLRAVTAQISAATDRLADSPTVRAQLIRYASQLEVFGPRVRDPRTVDADPGTVTSEPSQTSAANTLSAPTWALIAGLVGLVGAVAAALWRVRRERVIRADALTTIADCPLIPIEPGRTADGCRYARTSLLGHDGGVVAVAPLEKRDESSDWLVDALVRSLDDADVPAVWFDSAGAGPAAGPRVRSELTQLRATHRVVLTSAPPVTTSDGEALAVGAHAVMLTVVDGVDSVRRCRNAIARLRRLGVRVIGLIVVPASTAVPA